MVVVIFKRVKPIEPPQAPNSPLYLTLVEPIKELKREGQLDQALELCYRAIDSAERDRNGREPAPWYTEQAAIIHRKQGDREKEIAVLQRWMAACPPERRAGSTIETRLKKILGDQDPQ
jgi:tetratricopeptide (TPR) repeat protein